MSELIIYRSDNDSSKHMAKENGQYNYRAKTIKAAAEGIFSLLDDEQKSKYNVNKISELIKKSDKDNDGIITCEEAAEDIDNIFGLKGCDNSDKLDKIQKAVDKSVGISDMKGLEMGLNHWWVAKPYMLIFATKPRLQSLFSNDAAVNYYSEQVAQKSKNNKHLVELFKAQDIKIDDVKKMNFSEDVLNEIIRLY